MGSQGILRNKNTTVLYLLISLINLVGLELTYLRYPKLIYLVSLVVIFLTIFIIYHWIKKDKRCLAAVIISAFLYVLTHHLMLVFLEGKFSIHGFIILTSFVLFIFLYSIYDRYKDIPFPLTPAVADGESRIKAKYTLENIVGYFNLAISFFLMVVFFYLDLNTNQKFIWFLGVLLLLIMALSYSSLKVFDLISRQGFFYIGIIMLVLLEIVWLVNLLPVAVYAKAAMVSIVYYVILGLTRHYLIFGWEELSRKVVWRYLSISGLGIILVLGTSRW